MTQENHEQALEDESSPAFDSCSIEIVVTVKAKETSATSNTRSSVSYFNCNKEDIISSLDGYLSAQAIRAIEYCSAVLQQADKPQDLNSEGHEMQSLHDRKR